MTVLLSDLKGPGFEQPPAIKDGFQTHIIHASTSSIIGRQRLLVLLLYIDKKSPFKI